MSAITSGSFTLDELRSLHLRCSYPSKVCMNLRAVKVGGSLHKLCEFHRAKANQNQKRLQQRRRMAQAQKAMRHFDYANWQTPPHLSLTAPCDLLLLDELAVTSLCVDPSTSTEPRQLQHLVDCDDITPEDAQLLQRIIMGEAIFPTIPVINDSTSSM